MMKKVKVLKICCNDWSFATHDERELSAYKEAGASVAVLAKGEKTKYKPELVDGFKVYRCSTRPLGKHIPNWINRIISIFLWADYARKINPDFISGHDLSGLIIGWLSSCLAFKNIKLIYDSHEFEIYRHSINSETQRLVVKYLERFFIKRCEFSIMVNESIANEVAKIHKLKEKPLVIRNIPNNWKIHDQICKKRRRWMLNQMPDGEKVKTILMFHGNLGHGNGIENMLHSLKVSDSIGMVFMGRQIETCIIEEIKKISYKYNAQGRILIMDPVPYQNIWEYVGAADIEMMMIEPVVKSYYYTLPNKFFESIQSLVPIIATDLPEMERMINEYNIGIVCKVGDIDGMKQAVRQLIEDKDLYEEMKQNLLIAKKELCWENEKTKLISKFQSIMYK